MLKAITRSPGQELNQCELTHLDREPINIERAINQHRNYKTILRKSGISIIELPADPTLPDGVFVEDTAVILDELAIITSPTPVSRQRETSSIEATLRQHRDIVHLPEGAHLEGGDVCRIGKTFLVGLSKRTNRAGVDALDQIVRSFGNRVIAVPVTGCLHLKSALCALDDETLLINRDWVNSETLTAYKHLDVPKKEPFAANVLRLPNVILVSSAYPLTAELLRSNGFPVEIVNVSELHKAESGLTCMSLIFEEFTGKSSR